jgi:hypothetical protein
VFVGKQSLAKKLAETVSEVEDVLKELGKTHLYKLPNTACIIRVPISHN